MVRLFKMKFVQTLAIVFLLCFSCLICAEEQFPGRVKYKDVSYIELHDLFSRKNDVVIVDVRSQYEYDTLRIKGAINMPVASKSFESQILNLRQSTDKYIVFYCNGHRCMKSYQAVKKAQDVGVDNAVAFDGGIFDWTIAFPNDAVLLGQSPVDPNKLIGKKSYQSRLLNPDLFSEYVVKYQHSFVNTIKRSG